MKILPKIVLIVLSVLAVFAFLWVLLSASNAQLSIDELIAKPAVSFIIILSLIATIVTAVLFVVFKITDVLVHPSHLKELAIFSGIVLVAVAIGLVLGGSEDVLLSDGTFFSDPMASRLIGAGLWASLILMGVATVFLLIDAVKGILK